MPNATPTDPRGSAEATEQIAADWLARRESGDWQPAQEQAFAEMDEEVFGAG